MKNKNLITLLHIINSRGNIKRLTRQGLSFKDITELIELAVSDDLLIYDKEKISLTEKGNITLKNGQEFIKKTNKEVWIEKDKKNQIARMEKNTIFVPRQDELTF